MHDLHGQPLNGFRRAASSNLTDSAFPSKIGTLTEPSGAGVINLAEGGKSDTLAWIMGIPIGTGADNATLQIRALGWSKLQDGGTVWFPVPLGQFACTLCAATGVTGGDILATERFCDIITLDTGFGTANVTNVILAAGTGTELIGWFKFHTMGFQKIEFTTDLGTATAANVLWKLVSE